ncbi:MAG: Na/Pi cotransporter family protein [Odoribacter sp.]|nr:Na/Pi cotransporter family protein [Odoribacter sp.]MDY3033864.1 Na/Pi cotransporter family protein [Odoribacter sp.]
MEYGLFDFLKLIGSLGVFLYGMKLMSEALQKVAGERMRHILSAMTSNRVKGVITGILITAIIQSSSATTVMVVSFVNAGLLSLVESIGVIMGANVGTTVTAWLISILGFKVSMAEISLPMIGLCLPLLFSNKRSRKNWGELIIGFGLLFIGLEFLKNSMPNLDENPEMFTFLQEYADMGYASYILFMLIGTVLTILIQSSSATMALTLVMCANGWINFEIAASMVLGENIGTTVTANLAAMVANSTAKRAAFAHFLFNVFGVIWVLSIFPLFLGWIEALSVAMGIGNPETSVEAVPMALSLFHTAFNISNVLILIWFTKLIARFATKIIPAQETGNDAFKLKHIKIGLLSTPDTSLFQAKQEIILYGKNTKDMFHQVTECLELPSKDFEKKFENLVKMEDESDNVEVEIANYLTKVSESKMTTENSQRIRAMFKVVSEIESIADSSLNLAKAINRRNDQNVIFPEELTNKLKHMFALVEDTLTTMCNNLNQEYKEVTAKKAYELEQAINDYRTILKQEHLIAIEEKRYDYPTGILYNDMFSECEKIGDYAINVTQAIKEIGHEE